MKVGFIFGTRPEVIKLFPVIEEFRKRNHNVVLISTGQHRELIDMFLNLFELNPDYDFNVRMENRTLGKLSAEILENIDNLLEKIKPDLIFVQGDTTSAFIGALCGFYHHIPIAHVEAGLRTEDMYEPFPEEMNRRLISHIASFHFAPTERAVRNLYMEGIKDRVYLVGNTVVDSINWILENKKIELDKRFKKIVKDPDKWGDMILLTMHRRENWGKKMKNALMGIREYLLDNPHVLLIFPVHPNPKVKEVAYRILGELKNAILISPVNYVELLALIRSSSLILTDSGGIQEEAPSFGKFVLVLRNKTERQELMESGFGELIGTDKEKVYEAIKLFMEGKMKVINSKNPFGDGKAALRIADIIEKVVIRYE